MQRNVFLEFFGHTKQGSMRIGIQREYDAAVKDDVCNRMQLGRGILVFGFAQGKATKRTRNMAPVNTFRL